MDNDVNNILLLKLAKDKASLNQRLVDIEEKLLADNITTQKEIDILLEKQENIEKTHNFISQLQQIEIDVEKSLEVLKKAEKDRKAKYTASRINQLQAWADDHKMGANRTRGTSLGDSYQESVNYYQSQISSLLSSLES